MEAEIDINDQKAKEALEVIQKIMKKTKKSISSSYSSPMLILWGSLLIGAYTACHFYIQYAYQIFTVMNILGGIGSGLIVWWGKSKGPLKVESPNPLSKKIRWFWFSLLVYLAIWLAILSPFNGRQLNVVLLTGAMFAYIVMGLFYESKFLTVIGVCVTAVALLTYFFFTHYYLLSMAVFGGGSILGTGIYIRLMWR
jgi:hypothetical protein